MDLTLQAIRNLIKLLDKVLVAMQRASLRLAAAAAAERTAEEGRTASFAI